MMMQKRILTDYEEQKVSLLSLLYRLSMMSVKFNELKFLHCPLICETMLSIDICSQMM